MKGFYQKVAITLRNVLRENYQTPVEPPLWELPPRQELGDLSSMVALKLASKLKRDPWEIASELKVCLGNLLKDEVDNIGIMKPGFINLFVCRRALRDSLNTLLREKDNFFRQKLKSKAIIEFVSANPTGPLSIAHGRQAVVGDVIANISEFLGNKVEREYYINDEGRQIELLIESVKAKVKTMRGEAASFPSEGYKGEYVADIAKMFLKEEKKDLSKYAISYILSLIKKDLAQLGVKFDNWISQKELINKGEVKDAVDALRRKGLIYEKDKALWFSSSNFGDDKDRVIRKAEGKLTYFASDIAYHRDKIKRKGDRLINLWGPDHHGYIGRIMAAIEALGYNRKMLNIVIIQLVNIKTKERMSRRKGTAVLLSDLIGEVGRDASRFYYLIRKNSSHLEFDIDKAKEASFNNPLYYIQYACARIESIFRKAKIGLPPPRYANFLEDEEEISLLRVILQFSYFLEKAYYSLEPVFIIEYLKSLASNFHKFYERERILGETKKVMLARLNLLQAARIVLHCGLNLLGIKPAQRM